MTEDRERWQSFYDATSLRDVPFETMSGVEVEPVAGSAALGASEVHGTFRASPATGNWIDPEAPVP